MPFWQSLQFLHDGSYIQIYVYSYKPQLSYHNIFIPILNGPMIFEFMSP